MTSSPSNSEKPVYARHEKAHANGGIHLKDDPDSTVSVRSVVLNLIKSFGSKLKEGKVFDLLKVSRPAMISYPRTYLECVAHDLVYTNLLDKAATATGPVQRMKYLIGFFVAGLHRNAVEMGNNGPLNPVLGETFIAEKADGTKLYCEQISHHPPVSAYHMIDANGNYKLYGTGEVSAKLSGMNCLEGKRIGHTTIEFKDGGKVIIGNPEMIIEGVMMGDRIINHVKTFTFVDTTNKITAEIKFNYTPAGTVAKITSGFKNLFGRGSKNAEEKILNDTFVLEIFSTENQERKVLASGLGSWLSFVEIDGEALWQVTDAVETKWNEECNGRLDSDSTKRLDSQFIRIKDFKNAQKEKDLLENNQRLDAKIRKTGAKGAVKADA